MATEREIAAKLWSIQRKWPVPLLLTAILAPALSGCAAISFAPPAVNASSVDVAQIGTGCVAGRGKINLPDGRRNVEGAAILTDNFLFAYRCAQAQAANGRPFFEIPSFLALAAAALGPTYGMGEGGRIGLAGGAATLDRSRGYFAPKEKAAILNSALDAVICIKTESVGAGYFDTTQPAPGGAKADAPMGGRGGTVTLPSQRKYFEMVAAALFSVERILADRLSNAGKFDAAGITAELAQIIKDQKDLTAAEAAKRNKAQEDLAAAADDVAKTEAAVNQAKQDKTNAETEARTAAQVADAAEQQAREAERVSANAQKAATDAQNLVTTATADMPVTARDKALAAKKASDEKLTLAQQQLQTANDQLATARRDAQSAAGKAATARKALLDAQAVAQGQRDEAQAKLEGLVRIELDTLQPMLQKCVLRAKIG